MHATLRSIKAKPGQVAAIAELIRTEYLPLLDGIDGFVSYTLVDAGGDSVSSVGVFVDEAAADRANAAAREWTARRLAELVESPLAAGSGAVLVDHGAGRS